MHDPFAELKPPLPNDQALAEANRCLFCYDAPCSRACPTHIDVPAFIKKIATGNLRGSARTILEANILGASCARVCPTEVLCEGACVMNHLHHRPIDIGRLQRHATDWVIDRKEKIFSAPVKNGKRVAIIGAGPAGLGCAAELARQGYDVTIFEAADKPGGLNTFGVAEYKMSAETALREVEWVKELGVEIHCGVRVGVDVAFADLEKRHAAVFLGVGLGNARPLGVPGEELMRDAIEFIAELKMNRAAAAAKIGKDVVVLGGGNTAIDCVTQAARLGAENVSLVYRRGRQDMSAYAHEIELARKDGVRVILNTLPLRVREGALDCVRVNDELAPQTGSEFTLPATTVIRATGQASRGDLFASLGLRCDRGRPIHDAATMQTSNPRYFVGGDCANGGKEVVNAVAEGKRAASGIHRFLSENA